MRIPVSIDSRCTQKGLAVLCGAASLLLVVAVGLSADIWPPDSAPVVFWSLGLCFAIGQVLLIRAVWKSGGAAWYTRVNLPTTESDGRSHDSPGSAQPADDQLDIENLFKILMDYLPALVIVKNHLGRYLYVNPSSAQLFGKTPAQLIGHSDDEIWPKETADQLKEIDRSVLESRQVINTTAQFDVDGQERCFMVTQFPIHNQCEKHLLGGIIFDITANLRAEESRAQLEQQLIQSQKMEAIGTLAGGIAHDFNNILAAIFGYVELIRMDLAGNHNAQRQLNQVLQAAQRAKELIHQILAFSRKQERERRALDLVPLAQETIKLLRASLPASIEIQHHFNAKDVLVMADATQIHQVIMNLSTNAAHAMEARGGCLTIRINKVSIGSGDQARQSGISPGSYLELCVQDTGHGISPAQIKRIFEPFYTTKPQGKGTGMGLAVVHGIINSHGGVIHAQSRPGQGSTFRVLLPVTTQTDMSWQTRETILPKGTESILFVDDEHYLADVGHRMLSRLGYRVTCCTDPREALEAIRLRPEVFDLLVTDMTMPHMNGDVLAREVMDIRPDLPIILCTGFSEKITAETARHLGIAAFLMKPVTISDLACTLRNILTPRTEPIAAVDDLPDYAPVDRPVDLSINQRDTSKSAYPHPAT